MPALSMVATALLAYQAGLRNPVHIAEAVAVATGETGRNPAAIGDLALQDDTWGPSVGLWQIRSLKAEKGKGTLRDADKLRDPRANAAAMVEISKNGTDFHPWSVTRPTHPAGFARYQLALPMATAATAQMLADQGGAKLTDKAESTAAQVLDPVSTLARTVSEAAQTPSRVLNWLTEPGTWTRIAFFVLGGVLVVAGVAQVVKGTALEAAVPLVKAVK